MLQCEAFVEIVLHPMHYVTDDVCASFDSPRSGAKMSLLAQCAFCTMSWPAFVRRALLL